MNKIIKSEYYFDLWIISLLSVYPKRITIYPNVDGNQEFYSRGYIIIKFLSEIYTFTKLNIYVKSIVLYSNIL